MVSHLRNSREAKTIWFLVCGSSAKPKLFGFSFAELPRSPNHLVSHLRNSREAQTIWFLACGTSARLFQYVFLFGRAIYCPIPLRALPAPTRAFRPHVGTDPEGSVPTCGPFWPELASVHVATCRPRHGFWTANHSLGVCPHGGRNARIGHNAKQRAESV